MVNDPITFQSQAKMAISSSFVAIAMLCWAIFGSPPYAFFTVLKLVVAGSTAYMSYVGFSASKSFLPIAIILVGVGGIHLFSQMHRKEWATFNWAGIISLSIGCVVILIMSRCHRTDIKGEDQLS
jgi:glucose uptake protein GlcU